MQTIYDHVGCRRLMYALAAIGIVSSVSCISEPARIYQVKVDLDQRARSAVEHYDQDKNGVISLDESILFPALQRRFSLFDLNNNSEVDVEEIKHRLEKIFDPHVGLLSASCVVTKSGRPLKGASVRFVPEPFLADVLPAAAGVARRDGLAILSLNQEDLPRGAPASSGLMRAGLYRVEITHPNTEIPATYNRQTILGEEVSGEAVRGGPFRFDL